MLTILVQSVRSSQILPTRWIERKQINREFLVRSPSPSHSLLLGQSSFLPFPLPSHAHDSQPELQHSYRLSVILNKPINWASTHHPLICLCIPITISQFLRRPQPEPHLNNLVDLRLYCVTPIQADILYLSNDTGSGKINTIRNSSTGYVSSMCRSVIIHESMDLSDDAVAQQCSYVMFAMPYHVFAFKFSN